MSFVPTPKQIKELVADDRKDVALRNDFIGSVAGYRLMGYSKSEIADIFNILEKELDKVILANLETFKSEFENRRAVMMYNFEASVIGEMQKVFALDSNDKDILKEKVKLLNGSMNLIAKLQEKRVVVETTSKTQKITKDYSNLSVEQKKLRIKELRSGGN